MKTTKDLFILDNGGETFDRYTIVNTKDGEMIGASDHPFSPQGFGQYCGNVIENYWKNISCFNPSEKQKKTAISRFKREFKHIGKKIKFESLPLDVQKFAINYLLND